MRSYNKTAEVTSKGGKREGMGWKALSLFSRSSCLDFPRTPPLQELMTRGNKSHHGSNRGRAELWGLGFRLPSLCLSFLSSWEGWRFTQANYSIDHVITSLASFHCSKSTKEEPAHLLHQEGWRKLMLEGRVRSREGSSWCLPSCAPNLSRVVEKEIWTRLRLVTNSLLGSAGWCLTSGPYYGQNKPCIIRQILKFLIMTWIKYYQLTGSG